MTTTVGRVVYAVVSCLNEWCSGPERHSIVDGRPVAWRCPTCGWLALPGDGIRYYEGK